MQKRLATFDFPKDDADDAALERAWNTFVDAQFARGLRPSDIPIRVTDSSVTYRLFRIDHELEATKYSLDFDIAKLVPRAAIAGLGLVGIEAVASALAHLTWLAPSVIV